MRFAVPWALWLTLLAPVIILFQLAQEKLRKRRVSQAGDPILMRRLSLAGRDDGRTARWAQSVLLSLSIVLVAAALARPQYGSHTELRRLRGMDVAFALDLSRSMLAKDATPSRLARAKIELNGLLDQLTGDRVGLVGYTSIALPLAPLTVDHAAVKLQLEGAAPDDLPRGGTSLGAAIKAGRELLERSRTEGAEQALVIITDGEEHEGDPEAEAAKALESGIQVHVVGVGSQTGEPIPIAGGGYVKDGNGRTVVSRLNPDLVRKVAAAGGGIAALPGAQGGLNLEPVRARLAVLKKAEREDRVVRIYEERFAWPLGMASLLLLLATLWRPNRRALAVVLVLGLQWSNSAEAQPLTSEDSDIAAGRKALKNGEAEEAAKAFTRARERLGERPEILFNLGLADRARGEVDSAISHLKAAVAAAENPELRSSSAFALGNSLRQLKKWDEAIEAYKHSLLANPKQSGARRNLEVTQRMKAVAAAQPQDPNQEKEPGDEPPPDQDGGTPDSGDDGGGQGDASPPDAGSEDSGDEDGSDDDADGGGQSNDKDAGSSPDADEGDNGASPEGAKDAGQEDAGAQPPPPSGENKDEQEPEDEPDADKILDALEEQEKALQRKKQLEKFGRRRVEKDW